MDPVLAVLLITIATYACHAAFGLPLRWALVIGIIVAFGVIPPIVAAIHASPIVIPAVIALALVIGVVVGKRLSSPASPW